MAHDNSTTQPLLASDQARQNHSAEDYKTERSGLRGFLLWFLNSKYSHYFVILLVTVDIGGIFADFLIRLHMCENSGNELKPLSNTLHILEHVSLLISCLFMLELIGSIYAFGFSFFSSKFHIFDACSILASFLVDVLSTGTVEEAGTLLIAGRLFRVFKIIEESSTVAESSQSGLHREIADLKRENDLLRRGIDPTQPV